MLKARQNHGLHNKHSPPKSARTPSPRNTSFLKADKKLTELESRTEVRPSSDTQKSSMFAVTQSSNANPEVDLEAQSLYKIMVEM